MEKLVIMGAGQFGRAAAALINRESFSVLAAADRDSRLWGSSMDGIPVMSPQEAMALNPDTLLISVSGRDRAEAMKSQAESLGFHGKIIFLDEMRRYFDIRSSVLLRLCRRLNHTGIPGSVAELGVYKGDTAWKLNLLFPDRRLYLFDTFQGFYETDIAVEKARSLSRAEAGDFSDTSEKSVMSRLPFPDRAVVRKGFFPNTASGLEQETFALVSLDADLYAPTLAGLEFFYPRLSPGGVIILHDWDNRRFPGAGQAVCVWEQQHGPLPLIPLGDLHGTAVIIRP